MNNQRIETHNLRPNLQQTIDPRRSALIQRPRLWVIGCLAGVSCIASSPCPLLADGPTLKRLLPAGVGLNQTVEIVASGDAPKWPVRIWTDDQHVKWEALPDKGKFRVSVDGEARLGVHHVRFFDEDNSADAMRYIVGPIAEQSETEPNDEAKEACKVASLPIVMNGVLEKRGSVDTFQIELEQNQSLVAAVEANTNLRSPVDATVQVLSAKGTVLAQNLDRFGLDPAVEFVAPRKDKYLVRIFGFPETPDSTIGYAGGDNFVYRLSLSSSSWVRTIKPLAFPRKEQVQFQVDGVKLPHAEITLKLPDNFAEPTASLFTPGLANAPLLDVLDWPQSVEAVRPESGSLPVLSIPGSMTGTLTQQNERDLYSFEAKKGVKLSIALTSRRMGLPMDGVLRVLDQAGKQVAREDDTAKEVDARLIFQPPADGSYVLEVTDAFMAGGPDWVYRVDIQSLQGDVGLTVKADHFSGKANEEFEVAVAVERRDGFDRPIMVSLQGLDGKVACEAVKAEKDAKDVKLKLKASAAVQSAFRVVARREDDPQWLRVARLAGDPLLQDLWLTTK